MTKIIAFAGRKQSGKTTCAEFVCEEYTKNLLGETKIYNFADPLKQDICINILGLSYDQCYGSDEIKNQKTTCYWPDTKEQMTAREVMQYIGTDVFRNIQNNVWADATAVKIKKEAYDLAVIADCRFPNEVETIKQHGGLVIKLNRNIFKSNHLSEISLDENNYDQSNFDLIINNQELDIDTQNQIIYDFLRKKGILPL